MSGFFIESFQIPPFLLPIFQAAGTAYGIPWQVLAAINEVETDYGRDLSVSSAGAEGWMQFLPSEWAQYGVDANGDGFKDPYNPADAIFAAARYLRAAGGNTNIKAAVYSYNHSQAYVESVLLRAQLLGGTPSELLGAITGLTEARFPVHAASHYSDGFPTVSTGGTGPPKTLVGTTIYSQAGAPVIAAQDGEVVQIGDSPSLGRFVALRDAYGNTYVYAELGEVASVYPVLEPHVHTTPSPRIVHGGRQRRTGAWRAGERRRPAALAAERRRNRLGAGARRRGRPGIGCERSRARVLTADARARAGQGAGARAGLHRRRQRRLPASPGRGRAGDRGDGARPPRRRRLPAHPLPDPPRRRGRAADRPQADPRRMGGARRHVDLQGQGREPVPGDLAHGRPGAARVKAAAGAAGAARIVPGGDDGIRLGACARQDVQEGRVDKRVLAMLEYLSVSGLRPTVSGLPCAGSTPAAAAAYAPASASSEDVEITAVNGIPIAGHQGPGSIADETVRKLLMLQGLSRPQRIVSLMSYPGAAAALASPSAADAIHVAFAALRAAARARTPPRCPPRGSSPSEWIELIDRLGEIPDPTVGSGHSSAAIPDGAGAASEEGEARGND